MKKNAPINLEHKYTQQSAEQDPSVSDIFSPPSITLPKGGGAIKSIDEKFTVNPVNGTSTFSIPLPVSPVRQGFTPAVSLSYNSGSGNGIFGLGWNVDIPSISRKTDKGLPQYDDNGESDVYLLSGAEDLVPYLEADANKKWGTREYPVTEGTETYDVKRYRPRIESSFAKIERWTRRDDGDIHWRITDRNNTVSIYGRNPVARMADPEKRTKIFKWLIEFSFDDKGNCILYEYKEENLVNVPRRLSEAHRHNGHARCVNTFPEKIKYGAKTPYDPSSGILPDFMFETVFDYSAPVATAAPEVIDNAGWSARNDPFSDYHACFEIRTWRLCHRVLLFHHFDELGTAPCLVKSLDIAYQHDAEAGLNMLSSITAKAYKKTAGRYREKSIPPMVFQYERMGWDTEVKNIDPNDLIHAPEGINDSNYAWIDLYSEGVSGILTEQANAWWYKQNLGNGQFANAALVVPKPSLNGLNSTVHIQELEADGRKFLVTQGTELPGYFEMTEDNDWLPFQAFSNIPNVDFRHPGTKFIDLNGDGKADLFISEDHAFCWYASAGKTGFDDYHILARDLDEDKGPVMAYTDAAQSIVLTDINGDGLTDIVRIRNGEIVYWPNTGFGKFGAKVIMDNAPLMDAQDRWNPLYIRLTDINGTGTPDLVYLGENDFRVWFNQNGNGWSDVKQIACFPEVNNLVHITTVDLLANGTSCIVWSSPLPAHTGNQLRYIDLMQGKKPFVMTGYENNLGKKVTLRYRPSTWYYLQDKKEGKPWITKLPFPVQCVEKMIIEDQWRKTRFATTYSYHHGYFDYREREFRGFGRVEQVDVESFGEFQAGNAASPYITQDKSLYQPPVKTITWYHLGAAHVRGRMLKQFEEEYFPHSLASLPGNITVDTVFKEKLLPEPELGALDISNGEWHEALRACKGMTLRQEIYELDVDRLELGIHAPVRIFSAATHNCSINRVQPKANQRQAVFLVTESESLTYHYELQLTGQQLPLQPDPRIQHTMHLSFDDLGHVQQSVAVTYGRLRQHQDAGLTTGQLDLIGQVQQEKHLSYSETRYTKDFIELAEPLQPKLFPAYRLRQPYEVLTFELMGITLPAGSYFEPGAMRYLKLSEHYPAKEPPFSVPPGDYTVHLLGYHEQAPDAKKYRRLVEHTRTLFFKEDLSGPLALGISGKLALPYEQYKLALTDALLQKVFTNGQLNEALPAGITVQQALNSVQVSGYCSGADAAARFGHAAAGQYWICSGIAGYAHDAADHFYLPEKYTDAFGNVTEVTYDHQYDLFIQASKDPLGNTTRLVNFDYRLLTATEIEDINANRTEAYFDILGMVIAVAVKGKGGEADNLTGYDDALANPTASELSAIFNNNLVDDVTVRRLLGNASTRYVYHFGEQVNGNGEIIGWCHRPASVCAIVRERHVASLATGEVSPLQMSFECSDGMGIVLMKKSQAEPETTGGALRWIVSGKTVLSNKGKPVKQYEPYFTAFPACERELQEVGVTPVLYYDAAGRLLRTDMPDGTWSRAEFSPWYVKSYDANDTVGETANTWYQRMSAGSTAEQRTAELTYRHFNTPVVTFFDSLGRDVITMTHNKIHDGAGGWEDEKLFTFTRLDAEGKPLWIRDARNNLVMQYIWPSVPNNQATDPVAGFVPCYDIAGNLLFQHSMDSGNRWMLMDATGKPMLAWDVNERQTGGATMSEARLFYTEYDQLHRPLAQWLSINGATAQKIERFEYADAAGNDTHALNNNLYGQLRRHYDASGLTELVRKDFKGNTEEVRRTLTNQYHVPVIDWLSETTPDGSSKLEREVFTQVTGFDALGRMTILYNWHSQMLNNRVAVYIPVYNERGTLRREKIVIHATKTANGFDAAGSNEQTVIDNIQYNAKGQKESVRLGNGTITRYAYDEKTFRLRQLRTTRSGYTPPFPGFHAGLQDGSVLQQLHYTYDAIGNITEIFDEAYEPVFFQNQQVEARSQYEYDALYRLVKASGRENGVLRGAPQHTEGSPAYRPFPIAANDPNAMRNYWQEFEYDQVGNILRIQHIAGAGSYTRHMRPMADSNRLDKMWEGHNDWNNANAINKMTYSFDSHGNMLQLADVAPGQFLRWDYRDMIASLDLVGGGSAYYNYGTAKQRTRKRLVRNDGTLEDRIYLEGFELYRRYTTNGSQPVEEIESLHVFEGEQRVLVIDDVVTAGGTANPRPDGVTVSQQTLYRYQYSNHLGSASLELDHDAHIISYEEYHPYGTSAYRIMHIGMEVPPKRYRYTGMERDEESGLNYHGARYYAHWLSRWMSCDPVGIDDTLHIYAAFHNNPVAWVDKNGKQSTNGVHYDISKLSGTLLNSEVTSQVEVASIDQPVTKTETKQFWQRGWLSDKIASAWEGMKNFAGAMATQWQAKNLQATQVLAGAGMYAQPAVNPGTGKELSFSEQNMMQRSTSTKFGALGAGFGPNTASWMADQPYSLRGIEAETGQNAFAIGGGLLGALGAYGAAMNEFRSFAAAGSEFNAAMQSHKNTIDLYRTVTAGRPANEMPGLNLAIERMAYRGGWRLRPERLEYGAGRGLDLTYEGINENAGLFAHVEAKPPTSTPSALNILESSRSIGVFRQGGEAHVGFALENHIATGGANAAYARTLLTQLRLGNMKTLASLRDGLFEINYWGEVVKPY
jgi:RHS repeat-associated protein